MGAGEPDRPRGRILVIDDDPALGGFLSRVLRTRGGFEVTHELDPAAALRRIGEQDWDLLITDIEMPGMTGVGVGPGGGGPPCRGPCSPGTPPWTTRSARCAAQPLSSWRSRSPPRPCWPRPPSWSRRAGPPPPP